MFLYSYQKPGVGSGWGRLKGFWGFGWVLAVIRQVSVVVLSPKRDDSRLDRPSQ